jgi:hypothetical protein
MNQPMAVDAVLDTLAAIQADMAAVQAAMGVMKAVIAGNSRLLNDASQEMRFLRYKVGRSVSACYSG